MGEGKTEVDGGRAPLSIHASGRVLNRNSKVWTIDVESRQQSVWKRVSQLENLSGSRPTSSLQQIMTEDSTSLNIPTSLLNSSSRTLRTIDGQNSIIIAFDGVPLMLEAFSDERALRETIQSTIRSISFDIDHLDFIPTTKAKVTSFIESASLGKMTSTGRSVTNAHLLGGNEQVDANAISDAEGKLLHITALNKAHRLLQGV